MVKLPHQEKDYEAESQASFPMTGDRTQCDITCSELRNILLAQVKFRQ